MQHGICTENKIKLKTLNIFTKYKNNNNSIDSKDKGKSFH